MSIRIRVALVAALGIVLAANAGATIYAAATAPTITACVKSSGAQKGLMRYAAAGKCAGGETRLVWNGPGTWPTPPPSPTADSFGPGTWRVGSEIQPGTYRAIGDGSGMHCYWERLSGFGGTLAEIIENGIDTPPVVVTIQQTDTGFKSESCGVWTKVQ